MGINKDVKSMIQALSDNAIAEAIDAEAAGACQNPAKSSAAQALGLVLETPDGNGQRPLFQMGA